MSIALKLTREIRKVSFAFRGAALYPFFLYFLRVFRVFSGISEVFHGCAQST